MFEKTASAPASVILKELLEGRKASSEQQMRVLENRRQILENCGKSFSQKTLGQLACLDSGDGFYHELQKDRPRVVGLNNEFSLDNRGHFAGNLFCKKGDDDRLAFGFDCNSWLLVWVKHLTQELPSGSKYEKAITVHVTRVDLATILEEMNIDPTTIWMYFKIITEEWVSNRKSLYDQACAVAKGMNEEDSIFRMIS